MTFDVGNFYLEIYITKYTSLSGELNIRIRTLYFDLVFF